MSEREELMYRVARALDHSREAAETQHAADEGHDTPENAEKAHFDAAGAIGEVIERLTRLRERHAWDGKRMKHAYRAEQLTGVEFRGGDEAA